MLALALALIGVSHAQAAAWPQKPGHTEIIVSLEPGAAHRAFNAAGAADANLAKWSQTDAYIYIVRGVTSRLSLTGKVNFKAYDTGDTHFSGLSSVEFGGRYALHDGQDYVLAAGASLEGLGKGRRDDFDTLLATGNRCGGACLFRQEYTPCSPDRLFRPAGGAQAETV